MFRLQIALLLAFLLPISLVAQEKNSTRKIRIQPSDFASQCGSQVQWREDLESALAESADSGKPLFWYVPTVRGTFMDRKPVIDHYMLAGPFSWPSIIELLNTQFIPVKAIARGSLQKKYDLTAYKFVEPGFVIVDSKGEVKTRVDQITSWSPIWIHKLIADSLDVQSEFALGITDGWNALSQGNYRFDIDSIAATKETAAEKVLLKGMLLFRQGKHEQAREAWKTAQTIAPDHPLAWKAAAEAENWGPFVRGFETFRELPGNAFKAGRDSRGSAAPKETYSELQLWDRSVDFLLGMQNENGGWLDSDYDFGGTDSLPNVHVAVSSLCGVALLDAVERLPNRKAEIMESVQRAAEFCSNIENLNYVDRDEILWAHAYRVRFLARLVAINDFKSKYKDALEQAADDLESIQTARGTWYHEYANPFVTATALIALNHAESSGAEIDAEKIRLGVASLANDRFDNGAYPYYGTRGTRKRGSQSSGKGKIPESAGRMPLCELALWLWKNSDDDRLQKALTASFENHKFLAVGYKYDNHTSTMAYGGFFFWYDMRSRAEAIRFMKPGETQNQFANQHRKLVLALPELDGCFVDSHELGRCYGTAMALLTLGELDRIKK